MREFTGAMAGQVAVFSPFGQLPSGRSGVVRWAPLGRPATLHPHRRMDIISISSKRMEKAGEYTKRRRKRKDEPLGTRKKSMIFRSMAPLSLGLPVVCSSLCVRVEFLGRAGSSAPFRTHVRRGHRPPAGPPNT